ncbi:MAG: hypothetical protein K2W85_12070 [Phycisphaerales bacterium]|nr:hypothetical protein [Phycisphaerales bacterium]
MATTLALGLISSAAHAQWSSNPAVNTTVAAAANDQASTITRARSDGGIWVSYFDSSSGASAKPTVQRLTACGQTVFPSPGIVAGPSRTSGTIFSYDMRVDADGNCIIAFDNNGIFLQKILADGSTPWGANGVLMPGTANLLGPKLAIAGDGTIVVAASQNVTGASAVNQILFQRFNPDGTIPPGGAWSFVETTRNQTISDMLPSGPGGDVIALWVRAEGTNPNTSRRGLKIQKYSSTNAGLWNGGVPLDVFTTTGVAPTRGMTPAYFPAMQPDPAGGAIIAWYENGTDRLAYLQHYSSAGVPRFPTGGLPLSTVPAATESRLSASVAYDPPSESYVIAYQRSIPNQTQFGLAAQRVNFDPMTLTGTLAWGGGAGVDIIPISATSFQSSFIDVRRTLSGDAVISWIQFQGASSPHQIQSTRLDSTGTPVWTPTILVASSNATTKGRMSAAQPANREAVVCVWQDGASAFDALAQFIDFDGTLGTCPADFNCSADLEVADIFSFLNAWFASDPAANFDGGPLDVNDIFAFLNAWFNGC